MKKVVTLTFGPSLDCTSETDNIVPEAKIRCSTPVFEPGGGGINVSRVVTRLGGKSVAVYPYGGSTGDVLNHLLDRENIAIKPVICENWTRQNLNITSRCDQQQYRFIMPAAALTEGELDLIEQAVLAEGGDYLVISGSLPETVNSNFVINLIKKCAQQDTKVVFDCSGQPLIDVVNNAETFLVKPNARELSALTQSRFSKAGDLVHQARKLIADCKITHVIVSLGAQGALLVTHDICEQIIAPKVITNSTVGAGDSMVGAVVVTLAEGRTIREAIRMGVAAGTAATMNCGTELCKRDDVLQIYDWLLEQHPIS